MVKKHFIVLISVLMISCSNEKTQIYLIPNGYEGTLVLIEDIESNQKLEIKNDTVIFNFLESNILKINDTFIHGSTSMSNIKYFYVDDKGQRVEVPISIKNKSINDSTTVYVHLMNSQIRSGSQCDLICSQKNYNKYLREQIELCDSLFSIRP